MNDLSAPNIVVAPLEPAPRRISLAFFAALLGRVEAFLEPERSQLPLWFVAAVGAGIAAWFALPGQSSWIGLYCVAGAIALLGSSLPETRVGRALICCGIGLTLGCSVVWMRPAIVAAPRLERTTITELSGRVLAVETLAANGDLRLRVQPDGVALPPTIRLSLDEADAPAGLEKGARVSAGRGSRRHRQWRFPADMISRATPGFGALVRLDAC